MRRLDRILEIAMRGICLACLVLLFSIVAVSVVNRLVGYTSMGWADEIIELLFAWLIFVGAACLWREQGHFAVDMLAARLRGTLWETPLRVLLALLSVAFLAVLTWFTWQLVVSASDDSPVFAISKKFWYGVMPVAGIIMIGYSVRDLVVALRTAGRCANVSTVQA